MAAIPSSLPIKPILSEVLPLILIFCSLIFSIFALIKKIFSPKEFFQYYDEVTSSFKEQNLYFYFFEFLFHKLFVRVAASAGISSFKMIISFGGKN